MPSQGERSESLTQALLSSTARDVATADITASSMSALSTASAVDTPHVSTPLATVLHYTSTLAMTCSTAAMTAGAVFTSVVQSPTSAAVALRKVFVWYERDDGPVGSLYWCDVGSRTKLTTQCLSLHLVSDVFWGKQTSHMSEPAVSAYPSSLCFSLVAPHQALHLVAASEAVKTAWRQELHDVFVYRPPLRWSCTRCSCGMRGTSRCWGHCSFEAREVRTGETAEAAGPCQLQTQSRRPSWR